MTKYCLDKEPPNGVPCCLTSLSQITRNFTLTEITFITRDTCLRSNYIGFDSFSMHKYKRFTNKNTWLIKRRTFEISAQMLLLLLETLMFKRSYFKLRERETNDNYRKVCCYFFNLHFTKFVLSCIYFVIHM